ncbi:MAG: YraN family protein [Chlorobiaceae bacterium]|jgi:putative endonuclease
MLDPHQLGQEGERLAAEYLAKKGYHILKRNYRYHRHEIDIVAMHQTTLCFIEVKTRSTTEKGDPAEAVTLSKQREIIKAARAYLAFSGEERRDCRFEVVAIKVANLDENPLVSYVIEHFPDAFWATS